MSFLKNLLGRNHKMGALAVGSAAPDFTLPKMDGKQFNLKDALARGPVVLAFFKVSCPVCQFAFPYVERIYKAHGDSNVSIIGVSQNNDKDTAAFMREYGITFPIALDDTKSYPASNAYGLTNVPSLFYVAPDGTIEVSSVGWVRKEMEEINRKISETAENKPAQIFQAGEVIPDFRAG
jgi:peroxiredoxin